MKKLTVVEVNPLLDSENKMAKRAFEILESASRVVIGRKK